MTLGVPLTQIFPPHIPVTCTKILLIEPQQIHQLRLIVVYPTIYRVFFLHPKNGGGAVGDFFKHQNRTTDRGEDRLEGPALLLTGYWMDQRKR